MKKHIITAVVFAACLALCAAVWPQNEAVEETHAPPQASVVSAPEPTIEDIATETEVTLLAEKEKIDIPQIQAEPICEVINEPESASEEYLRPPKYSRHRYPLRHLSRYLPHRKRSLTRNPAIWSMSPASAGWNVKAPARSFMTKVYTKTAIRSAPWDRVRIHSARPEYPIKDRRAMKFKSG